MLDIIVCKRKIFRKYDDFFLIFQACTTCSKTFSNASALAKHRLTHSEERKYHCNQCSKAFKRQDHLNGHLLTHREDFGIVFLFLHNTDQ